LIATTFTQSPTSTTWQGDNVLPPGNRTVSLRTLSQRSRKA
jgi:hypothetical protein